MRGKGRSTIFPELACAWGTWWRYSIDQQPLNSFLESVQGIGWFSHAGEPSEQARVVDGLQIGWDGAGKEMLQLWRQQTYFLETQALESLDGESIDQIFYVVSDAIDEPLYKGLCNYLDRIYIGTRDAKLRTFDEGVFQEVIDSVKRDVCWAAVEHVLQIAGFFSKLLALYRQGRWACSWDGDYPEGRPVIL